MELQCKKYNKGKAIQKRQLYKIDDIDESVLIETEEHHGDDNFHECFQSKIRIPKKHDLEIFFGEGYKPEGIKGCDSKDTDMIVGFCNRLEKKIKYYSVDMKRNLITFSSANSPEKNLKITYNVISHLIEQWDDNLTYANMWKSIYRANDLDFFPIVATRYFSQKILEDLLVANETNTNVELPSILDKKRQLRDNEIKQKINVLRDFKNNRVELNNQYYSLEIVVLDKQEEKKRYFKCYEFEY